MGEEPSSHPDSDPTARPARETGPGPEREALEEALAALRGEIRARLPIRESGSRRIDWLALYEGLRRRASALGMTERSGEVDEFGMDEVTVRRAQPLFDFLADRYWRVEATDLDRISVERPCLFVANRAGLLPWDGIMIAHLVARRHPCAERPRFLVADWLVTLPFAQATLARIGGVRACRENAERLLQRGRSVVAFPEGAKGATKVFRDRYRLQRFGRGGIVRTAIAARVSLIPVAVVGAEEAHPVLFRVQTASRAIGVPFLPVTPTFPLLGPLGLVPLPSKWSIRFGEPVDTLHLPPQAGEDELLVWRLTEEIRQTIQRMVDAGIEARESIWA